MAKISLGSFLLTWLACALVYLVIAAIPEKTLLPPLFFSFFACFISLSGLRAVFWAFRGTCGHMPPKLLAGPDKIRVGEDLGEGAEAIELEGKEGRLYVDRNHSYLSKG